MKRPHPLLFLAVPVVVVVLGLSEVNWEWNALPGWFWGWAVLCTLLTFAGSRMMEKATPERPLAHRVWLTGLSWGVPVAAMTLSTDLLGGRFTGPNLPVLIAIRLVALLLMSLFYGSVFANSQRRRA